MEKINAVITGVGGYVPEYVLNNDELSRMVDTNDEWIMTRIGIKERRILNEEGLGTSYMARKAVKQLLEKTGTDPQEVDCVIIATTTPDYHFPSTSSIVVGRLGMKNAFDIDRQAACGGFVCARDAASGMIQSGRYKKIIVCGADKMSSIVDYTDRATCPIFGDGAAAVMLEPSLAILDETDSGLDVDAVKTVSLGVEEYQKTQNGALLIITHSTRILEALKVDYTHVLVNGNVVATGDSAMIDDINENGFERFIK